MERYKSEQQEKIIGDELGDLVVSVDINDNETGLVPRKKAHEEGILHRISVVYLTNSKGEILIQERMDGRYDHSSAGHVDPGETYIEAAARELFEELGVSDVTLEKKSKGFSVEEDLDKGINVRHIFEIFSVEASPQKIQKTEVKSVFWANPLDINKDMDDNPQSTLYAGGFRASLPLFLM